MNVNMPEHDSIDLRAKHTEREIEQVNYWLDKSFDNRLKSDFVHDKIIQINTKQVDEGRAPLTRKQITDFVKSYNKEMVKAQINPNLRLGYEMGVLPKNPTNSGSDIVTVYRGLQVTDESAAASFAKGVRISDHRTKQQIYGLIA